MYIHCWMHCFQHKVHILVDGYPQALLYGALCDQEGSTSWSLVWLARDSQGVLPSRRLGAVSDGYHRGTLSPHVLVQGRSIEETLGVTTSTDKLEVKVLPHMAESHVRVLINNSAVGTESELPAPPLKVKQLPHEALVTVEV